VLEHRRQHYLSLLGIDNYVPTRLLANAAPSLLLPDELLIDPALLSSESTQLIEPSNDDRVHSEMHAGAVSAVDETAINHAAIANTAVVDSSSVETAVDTSVVDITAVASTSPRALLEQELLAKAIPRPLKDMAVDNAAQATEKRKHIDAVSVADQSTSSSVHRVVKFVFSVWRVKDILILDIRKVREALPTDYLLQNILRSVGYGVAQLPASESLRWPLFDNKRLDNKKFNDTKDATDVSLIANNTAADQVALSAEQYKNDSAQASAMVQAYISAQHSKSPLKYLFLMGEEATTFTLDSAINFADYNGSAISIKFLDDVQCLIMPSLYSMLQEPSSKRIAWSALESMSMDAD
jgi:hypothetical protein